MFKLNKEISPDTSKEIKKYYSNLITILKTVHSYMTTIRKVIYMLKFSSEY